MLNDTVKPVKLGTEIGQAQGVNLRYRMFSLVDRTNLKAFAANGPAVTASPIAQPVALSTYTDGQGNTWTVAGANVSDSRTGGTLTVGPGTSLVFEPDTDNEETVVLNAASQAIFTRTHPAGVVHCRGNAGPWTTYDLTKDSAVVLYWSLIR